MIVVLGAEAERLRNEVPVLHDARVQITMNDDPSRGMFSSLQAGLARNEGDPILVLPGDMPFVHSGTIATLLSAYERTPTFIVSPRYNGKRGHPVVLPPDLRTEILSAEATGNLHYVLRDHPDRRLDVDVTDRGVGRDVDTVGDLQG